MGQVDSKKELDKLLKSTCEAFIMAITKLTVEPMLSFITKVTAFRVAPALSAGQPLRQQVCLLALLHNLTRVLHIAWKAGFCSRKLFLLKREAASHPAEILKTACSHIVAQFILPVAW